MISTISARTIHPGRVTYRDRTPAYIDDGDEAIIAALCGDEDDEPLTVGGAA
jgi:hypothetical protein